MICKRRKRIIGKVNFLCENTVKAKIVTGDYKDKQILAKTNFENVNCVSSSLASY